MSLLKKKLITMTLAISLIAPIFMGASNVFADSNQDEAIVSEVIDVIEENISIDSTGITLADSEKVVKEIDDSYVEQLNELAKEQELDISYTKEELIKTYKDAIENLNQEIEYGNLEVLEDGSMIDANDNSFYVQGGSTYDKTYWWGKARYKSTTDANRWVYELNSAANLNTGAAVIAGAVFGGVGAVPNGLTAVYCYQLANSVSYRNGTTSRGIIANINWTLIYSVKTQ